MSNNTKAYQGKWNSLEIISETSDNRFKVTRSIDYVPEWRARFKSLQASY